MKKMNLKEFLWAANASYLFKLLDKPDTKRLDHVLAYAYSKLPVLDSQATALATKMLNGGGRTLNVQYDGVTPTIAEYLLDSWYCVVLPESPRVKGQLNIPQEEIQKTLEIYREALPMGAM